MVADRVSHYEESTGESTTTSQSYQDKATLTFTPDDNSTYIYIASCLINGNVVNRSTDVILINTTDSVTFNTDIKEPRVANTSYITGYFMGKQTFGASPGSKTIKIQFRSESVDITTKIKEARIFAIKLTPADEYAESLGESTTTSTTFQNKHDLIFTPATTGDYLIIWNAQIAQANINDAVQAQIIHSSTVYGLTETEPKDITDYVSVGTFVKLNLANSSQTISTEFRQQRGSTAKIKNSRILALRLDEFHSSNYQEARSEVTTTSEVLVDITGIPLTFSPTADDYLEIYTSIFGAGGIGTGNVGEYQERRAGAAEQDNFVRRLRDALDKVPVFMVKKRTETAGSKTYDIRHKTAGGTTKSTDSAMAFLQLTQAVAAQPIIKKPGDNYLKHWATR